MRILSFVEGQGEQSALPVLLSRLHQAACDSNQGFWAEPMIPLQPWRLGLTSLSLKKQLQAYIRRALDTKEFDALLVLADAEDVCPKTEAERRSRWIAEVASNLSSAYVFAYREYETWFLASLRSLQGVASIRTDACFRDNPEGPRGAKEKLEEYMIPRRASRYRETVHQKVFTGKFDLATTYHACRSFRKLVKAFGDLYKAKGKSIPEWPPTTWTSFCHPGQ